MWGWARKKKIEGKRATYQHSGEDASFLLTPDFLVLGKSGSNCCKGHLAAALTSFVKCAKRDSINCYTFRPQTLYINKGNLPRKKTPFFRPHPAQIDFDIFQKVKKLPNLMYRLGMLTTLFYFDAFEKWNSPNYVQGCVGCVFFLGGSLLEQTQHEIEHSLQVWKSGQTRADSSHNGIVWDLSSSAHLSPPLIISCTAHSAIVTFPLLSKISKSIETETHTLIWAQYSLVLSRTRSNWEFCFDSRIKSNEINADTIEITVWLISVPLLQWRL